MFGKENQVPNLSLLYVKSISILGFTNYCDKIYVIITLQKEYTLLLYPEL